ncbi:MAG: hypothetical protein A4E53_01265 [Pelotomaculum sp. PtaB.Bin104]|nr:MAG: hypothetical protein A4E53_01265 [Pelotomaculum sp. PtaB.Bin104]
MSKNKPARGNKIHEPLSSYYPSPFKLDEPTIQNFPPPYYGHGAVYVSKEEKMKEDQQK